MGGVGAGGQPGIFLVEYLRRVRPETNVAKTNMFTTRPKQMLLKPLFLQHFQKIQLRKPTVSQHFQPKMLKPLIVDIYKSNVARTIGFSNIILRNVVKSVGLATLFWELL